MPEQPKADANSAKMLKLVFGEVYPLYVKKAERKGRTKEEVDEIISWLTGYDAEAVRRHIEQGSDFETFFAQAPGLNPNASKIKGTICGYRVEEIADARIREIRCLDKLVDELAKGRAMEKILRA